MGCDVHLWAEYFSHKTKKWMLAKRPVVKCEDCKGTGKASRDKPAKCYWCNGTGKRSPDFYEGRCYDDFAIMADVRNGHGFAGIQTGEGFKVISKPRGVPKNATQEYKRQVQKWNMDGHSHSWLSLQELLDFDWTQETVHYGVVGPSAYNDWWKTKGKKGAPASYSGGISGGNVKNVTNADMEKLIEDDVAKVRPVDKIGIGEFPEKDEVLYVTRVQWGETYKESAFNLWHVTIPALQELATKKKLPPDKVRIVFFFDN